MAKQSGLHQIRGKVGEHSYYRQTGVASGLIRSINQAMSNRVKVDEAFANTRLNNSEFGGACNVAGLLGKLIIPKFRPMILPFSQSKMAQSILELARQSSLPWGARVVQAADTPELCSILTSMSKRALTDFLSVDLSYDEGTTAVMEYSYTAAQASLMASLGINKLEIKVLSYDVATGKYNSVDNKIQKGYIRERGSADVSEVIVAGEGGTNSEDYTVSASFTPTPELYTGHRITIVEVLPIRSVSGVDHILQEYCSFIALESPSA